MTATTLLPRAIAPTLEALAPLCPAALVPAEALHAAIAAARGLPPIFHWAMLETRLVGDDRTVDLLAAVIDVPGGRERVAAALADPAESPALAPLAPILGAWSSPRGPHLAAIRVVWFEWDAPFRRAAPIAFPSVDPRFWAPPGRPHAPLDPIELALAGHRAAHGLAPPPEPALLRRLVAALGPAGRLLSATRLVARGAAPTRLFVSLPPDAVLPFLDAIEWPGDHALVRRWLPRVVPPWEPAFLQLEIDARVLPYLAIEPRQTAGAAAELRERAATLDALVDAGLAAPERAAAVLAWLGQRPSPADPRVVERRSFHLKLTLDPARPPAAKAYLGVHGEAATIASATAA